MILIQVNHFFQRIDLEKIIWNTKQPWDKDQTSNNDIVILKLKSPLKFNDNVQPACLPDVASFDKARANKQMAALTGWGLLKDKSKLNTKEAHTPKTFQRQKNLKDFTAVVFGIRYLNKQAGEKFL